MYELLSLLRLALEFIAGCCVLLNSGSGNCVGEVVWFGLFYALDHLS